ncbi:MAG: WD40 repeat domain-containing protein [Chloracidobacterium sp.]|nr:WD40 repeat domain-containing protein [Chloracidobacterium sp.]
MKVCCYFFFSLLFTICLGATGHAQTGEQAEYQLYLARRINAHGNEFNAAALTPDERYLIIGTEKGELLVWGLADRRIVRSFKQNSPIHGLVMLADGRSVVTAGGWHTGEMNTGTVGRWDLESGDYKEWPANASRSFYALTGDPRSDYILGVDVNGRLTAWSDSGGQVVATWELNRNVVGLAVIGNTVYMTTVDKSELYAALERGETPTNTIQTLDLSDPTRESRQWIPGASTQLWDEIVASPDGKYIACAYKNGEDSFHIAILDATTGSKRADFQGKSLIWSRPDLIVLFDNEWPSQLIRLRLDGKHSSKRFPDGPKWHASGQPADLTTSVASSDGSRIWGIFRQGAALVQWEPQKERAEILSMTHGSVYAMDARENRDGSGLLLSGGDDGYARVWNLTDLSLRREFRMPTGVPQGVGLLGDGRRAVISCGTGESPTDILIADIETGELRHLLTVERPGARVYPAGENFFYRKDDLHVVLASPETGAPLREFATAERIVDFAVSANGKWLVIGDAKGSIYLFETRTGNVAGQLKEASASVGSLAVSSDGGAVYVINSPETLMRWDVKIDEFKILTSVPFCYAIRLSADESKILIGGHHRDVGIYDAKDGRELLSIAVASADFSVTNVWSSGERLIFTTDAGVLLDGRIERNSR